MFYCPPPQVSVASSEYTDASDFDDDDFDCYDVSSHSNERSPHVECSRLQGYEMEDTLHPLIEEDVARVQQLFGRNSIETR